MRIILFNKSLFLDNTSSGLFSTIIDLDPHSINLDHGINDPLPTDKINLNKNFSPGTKT